MCDVLQLHVQLQQQAEVEQVMLSTPDGRTHSSEDIATDDDVDAALDDLQTILTGDETNSSPTSLLNKCPELRAYLLVYQ